MTRHPPVETNRVPLPLLDIDVLRTFVTIAETGSFTQAARRVFRTPSALSMQIKRLEDTLGQALFVREARQVRLTPGGELLLGYSRRLLKLNEEAVTQFLTPSLEGRVGFGTSNDIGTRILPNVLAQFARTHPAVHVDVVVDSSANMLARLDANELDLVLITTSTPGQSPHSEVVHSEPLVWTGRDGGLAAQCSPLPIALAHHGCVWRRMALTALDHAGIDYRIAYTCEHYAGQEAAMLADLAVAPFPQSLIKAPLRRLDNGLLPPLGNYQIEMVKHSNGGEASEALSGYVFEAFRALKPSKPFRSWHRAF